MSFLDTIVVVAWLGITFAAGLWFSRRASASTDDFFVTDRSLPWWVVGTSMVATTFAADTPLAVAGYVAAAGIADNWKWWFTAVGAVAGVFLFAKLWRRAEVVTDAELVELRYGGTAGKALRAIRAVWFGVFMNLLVVSWVMRAMRKVVEVVLRLEPGETWTILGMQADASITVVLVLFVMAVAYTVSAGLWGVVATDLVQFVLAMTGAILLAVISWNAVGGLEGMQAGFAAHGFDWEQKTALFPLNDPAPDGATAKLVVLLGVIWWSSKNVDAGGYVAQRLFATKDERHAVYAMLWYTTANICLRPWPWIIVGLAGMAHLGPLDDPELYYPEMMVAMLPAGLFGLMVASFLAAFMSTIDTQLNWGASLVINDVYRRFVVPDASEAHQLMASRLAIVVLAGIGATASFWVEDVRGAWELALSVTSGIGAVYVARWYWWRVNAWSEITAMLVAMAFTGFMRYLRTVEGLDLPAGWLSFPFDAGFAVIVSVPIWLAVTYLTAPCDRDHLQAFYDRVRPGGPGWVAVVGERALSEGPTWRTGAGIVAGTAFIYGTLLFIGALLLGSWVQTVGFGVIALVGAVGTAIVVQEEANK